MKIGIITHFYKNLNYGGVLQAYALCKALEYMGYSAEQISYQMKPHSLTEEDSLPLVKRIKFKRSQKQLAEFLISGGIRFSERIMTKIEKNKFQHIRQSKEKKFENFSKNNIPQSNQVYSEKDIWGAEKDYDVFITGSDQVWNPDWYCSDFFLKFIREKTPKLSYAAGISKVELSSKQREIFRENLEDFSAISVREEEAVKLLTGLVSKPVTWVLDPTLLLKSTEWELLCTQSVCQEKYVLCYYLSENMQGYYAAKQYAKKHQLKLVNIPYTHNKFRWLDVGYGDDRLNDLSPEEFISAIRYAECIFTDSFHAVVFSSIFRRPFFVFTRVGGKGMESRLRTLTGLLNLQERFCDSKEKATLDYLESVPPVDYSAGAAKIEKMRQASFEFLKENLNNIHEQVTYAD